jgi:Zn-dependent membrane protease YugP
MTNTFTMAETPGMLAQMAQPIGFGFGGWGLWLLCIVPPLLLGLWAQMRVKSAYARASQVGAASGMSGAEVASEIMRAHGINNVRVEQHQGFLSDHYDPRSKVLNLSPDVYNGRSVASLGIAAHEAGHALQDAHGYGPLKLRSAIVPLAQVGGVAANIAIMGGMLFMFLIGPKLGVPMLILGIAGMCCVALFQLITLPVEFDASRRAKDLLTSTGLIAPGEEAKQMNRVLNAAALTYIAALVSTLGTILYYVLILMSAQRRD